MKERRGTPGKRRYSATEEWPQLSDLLRVGGWGVFVAARLGSQVPQPNRKQHIRDVKKEKKQTLLCKKGKKQVSPAIS